MKFKKLTVLSLALSLLLCFACTPEAGHRHTDADGDGVCDECDQPLKEQPGDEGKFDLKAFESLPEVPLSDFFAVEEGKSCKLKMKAPYSDQYRISYSGSVVSSVEAYDAEGKQLNDATATNFTLDLEAGEIVYLNVVPVKSAVRLNVSAKENSAPFPFGVRKDGPDPASYVTTSEDPADPLEEAEIVYTKRPDTLYIYSNSPESLTPAVVNSCLTREEVSDRSVFFTFEHQSQYLVQQGMQTNGVYFGYRVTNTGTEDMYVTVKNLGLQMDGAGCWYGQQEWVDFYNTAFSLDGVNTLRPMQKQLFERWLNFSLDAKPHEFRPTTYRIPAGKYMYVIGGTTADAFGGFNVAGTANLSSEYCPIANGAVLFDVVGKAEGAFYVYTSAKKIEEGNPDYKGNTYPYGDGWDEGYVIDSKIEWTFNDATPAQTLPVTYTNYYSDTAPNQGGIAGTPIPDMTPHTFHETSWGTHLEPLVDHKFVGSDISELHSFLNGEPSIYGTHYYGPLNEFPSIGNWMHDYQDFFTFVNRGDKDRTVRINITPNGVMPCFIRNADGTIAPEYEPFFAIFAGSGHTDGEPFDLAVHAEIVIPAHSVRQVVVEYNLMANSYGAMKHSVDLI